MWNRPSSLTVLAVRAALPSGRPRFYVLYSGYLNSGKVFDDSIISWPRPRIPAKFFDAMQAR
jgi:hypothetical protein